MQNLRKLFTLLFIIQSIILYSQRSADHLEPAEGIYKDWFTRIGVVADSKIKEEFLLESYTPIVRFIIQPSFEDEGVLDLYFCKEKYFLLFTQIVKVENVPESKIYKSEIDSISAHEMKSLFETAISEAKYYVPDYESDIDLVGIDGTTYYFIMNNHPDKAGRTSFPSVDSNMWKLVRIASGLVDYAKTEEFIRFDEDLILRIEQLKKDLVKKP